MRRHFNQRGSLVASLALAALFSFIAAGIVTMILNQVQSSSVQRKFSKSRLIVTSAIETFMVAIKHAEAKYFINMRHCQSASLFYSSLVHGHHCDFLGSGFNLPIFGVSDLQGLDSDELGLITYQPGWQIRYNQEALSPSDRLVATIRVEGQDIKIYFYGISQTKDRADFGAEYGTKQGIQRVLFSVFASDSANRVHMSSTDAKMVNERSYAKDPCLNSPWSSFELLISGTCSQVPNLGSGSGLAFYEGNYFGLRPFDGTVVSMKDLNAASYFVQENGNLGGTPVFPEHKREALQNVDDFEVIGLDQGLKKIVTVLGSGLQTRLAYYDTGSQQMVTICKLGEMDFGRSFSGLAAAPGNQDIFNVSSSSSVATFYLKSDSGEIVNLAIKMASAVPYAGIEAQFVSTVGGKKFVCAAIKDRLDRDVENARTLGLTKGGLLLRPYYIY